MMSDMAITAGRINRFPLLIISPAARRAPRICPTADEENQQRDQIGGRVVGFCFNRRILQGITAQGNQRQHEETAGAGPKKTVVKTDGQRRREGEFSVWQPRLTRYRAKRRHKDKNQRDHRQQQRQRLLQRFFRQILHRQRAASGAERAGGDARQQAAELDLPAFDEIPRRQQRAAASLQLVGGERRVRRQPGEQQRGNGQHAAATREGIHETGNDADQRQQCENPERQFSKHRHLPPSTDPVAPPARAALPFSDWKTSARKTARASWPARRVPPATACPPRRD